jgi:peptidoglycan-N-acetylglucosamine deacetylase
MKRQLILYGLVALFITTIPRCGVKKERSREYTLYLTFDDGPGPGTAPVKALCHELNLPGTFFLVPAYIRTKQDEQLARELRDGYPKSLIANHSWSHAHERYEEFYQHPDVALADIFLAQETLNIPFKLVRLPGNNSWLLPGKSNVRTLARDLADRLDTAGYRVIGWDLEWNFKRDSLSSPIETAEQMDAFIEEYLVNGSTFSDRELVLLMHDRMFQTTAALQELRRLLQLLKKKGYEFATIDKYNGDNFLATCRQISSPILAGTLRYHESGW